MYNYLVDGVHCASLTPLDLPATYAPSAGEPLVFLTQLPPQDSRLRFRVTHSAQLTATAESIAWLDPERLPQREDLPLALTERIEGGTLFALNCLHPQWKAHLHPIAAPQRKHRVHLVAVGDVGGTFATGLKLLGGDCIDTIGLFDLYAPSVSRWEQELGQVSYCDGTPAMPKVEAVEAENLFQCDVLVFAATKSVPPVGDSQGDVRMAQLEANRGLIAHYGKLARQANFQGLFMVLSDPVDPLCKAVYQASNLNEAGIWDGQGLLPEQVQGFGLGVMQARARYFAEKVGLDVAQIRSFGPHGNGLVVANSLTEYDEATSLALTEQVLTANLKIRDLGFKPYIAPALSSGAFQLLRALRGEYHESSVCLGGIWFGARNRFTPYGVELLTHPLPDGLYNRLLESQALLQSIG